MKKENIEAYGQACRILFDVLDGHLDEEKLALMYDKCQEYPMAGLVDLHRRAIQLHLLSKAARQRVGAALDKIENDGTENEKLTTEEQADFILAWYKAGSQGTYTVSEAAKLLGYSRNNIIVLIKDGKLAATQAEGKPYAPWTIEGDSLRELAKRKGIKID